MENVSKHHLMLNLNQNYTGLIVSLEEGITLTEVEEETCDENE